MVWKFTRILFSAAVLWLVGCNSPPTATIPPSPIAVSVSYSPYLARIQDALHACALELPQAAVFFDQTSGAEQDFKDHDLFIWWGEKPAGIDYAYQLSEDALVVIVNPENPKQELSQQELNALFSGRIETWTDIGILDEQVKVWIFPETNLLSETFTMEVLGEQRFTRLASVAPSPQAMLESVGGDPGAIGFLPRSWLSQDVSVIKIDPDLQTKLHKPLLALTHADPKGELQALVACLQSGPGGTILAEDNDQSLK